MDSAAPEQFSKRILLAVTGLSPQIITETLYALAVNTNKPFVPTEIHLITTSDGAERAKLALLSDEPGWFHKLIKDYHLPQIRFTTENIHCVKSKDGAPLQDIKTPDDNRLMADFITEKVRHFTADPNSALHASIAGGRKTMGFYLGYAVSLYGRPQDRLSHVLVSEPYESSWDFFYPTPCSRVITTRDNKLADTRDAEVTLAEIPFVSLRHELGSDVLNGQRSFSEAVTAAQRAIAPQRLVIDLPARKVEAAGISIELPPKQLALLSLFARRALNREPRLPAPCKDAPDPEWARLFLAEYRALGNDLADISRTEAALKKGMDGDYFSQCKSQLHKQLKKSLGIAAKPYLIDDGGTRPRQYGLELPAEAVVFGKLAKADFNAKWQKSSEKQGVTL